MTISPKGFGEVPRKDKRRTARSAPRIVAFWLNAVLMLGGGASPSYAEESQAESRVQAARLVNEGNKLFDDHHFEEALAKYREARRIYPSPKILFNVGEALRELGRNAEAADTYAAFLEGAELAADSPVARKARERLEGLDLELGRLTLSGDLTGVEVTLDSTPLEDPAVTRRVPIGAHTLKASKPGLQPFVQRVEIVRGAESKVTIALSEAKPLPDASPVAANARLTTAPPAVTDSSGSTWWIWVALASVVAVGAGVAIVAATTGGDSRTPTGELPGSSTAEWTRY